MTPEQLQKLRLVLSSGAPIPPGDVFPELTQLDVAEALSGVDVCFRDYGIGALEVRSDDLEADAKGFSAILDVAATVEVADRAGDIVKVRGGKKRTVWNPMSGESVVKPGGFRTDNFMRAGGPVLWAHNRDEQLPPVGEVIRSRIGKVALPDSFGGGRADAVIQTLGVRPDEDLPVSMTVARLAAMGSLKTFSVGFARIHADFVKDAKERKAQGLGDSGIMFLTSDQAELSFTPTPMNPLAVTLGMKAAGSEDLVARDVEKGLKTLRSKGLLSRSEHDKLHGLLLPMSGDARAELKVNSFIDFGAHVRATGLWPVFDDATATEQKEAAAAVEVEPVPQVTKEAEERISVVSPGDEEGALQEADPEEEAPEVEAPEQEADLAEEVAEGLRRQLEAERAVSNGLREELAISREEALRAKKEASEAKSSGGALSPNEYELLWAAYETVSGVEGTIGRLIEGIAARNGIQGVDPADQVTSMSGDVAKAIGSVVDRILVDRGISAGGAPAPRPGPPRSAPGDSLDVGEDGAAVVRLSRQLLERSGKRST